jgi:NADPH-dependent 7-cyano-7-deazaguanine reductase QueF-like protein
MFDTAMSDTSTNAVQNKTIKTYIDSKSAGSMSLSGSVLTLTAVDGSDTLSTVTLPAPTAPDTALDTASANTVENKVVALAINSINTQPDGLAAAINTITGA